MPSVSARRIIRTPVEPAIRSLFQYHRRPAPRTNTRLFHPAPFFHLTAYPADMLFFSGSVLPVDPGQLLHDTLDLSCRKAGGALVSSDRPEQVTAVNHGQRRKHSVQHCSASENHDGTVDVRSIFRQNLLQNAYMAAILFDRVPKLDDTA